MAFLLDDHAGLVALLLAVSTAGWIHKPGELGYPSLHVLLISVAVLAFTLKRVLSGRRLRLDYTHWSLAFFAVIATVGGWLAFARFSTFQPLAAFGFVNISTNIWGIPSGSVLGNILETSASYGAWVGLFLIASNIQWSRSFRRKLMVVAAIIILTNLAAVLIQVFLHPSAFGGYAVMFGRSPGLMEDFNALGHTSALLLTFLFVWGERSRFGLALGAVIVAGALGCLLYSGSRSPVLQIVLSAVAGVFLLIKSRGWKLKIPSMVFTASILVVGVVVLLIMFGDLGSAPLFQRLGYYLSSGGALGEILNARNVMFPLAVAMITTYPLSGYGPGTFFVEVGNISASLGRPTGVVDNALNLYLNIGAELGVIALGFLLITFYGIVRAGFRSNRGNSPELQTRFAAIVFAVMLLMMLLGPHILNPSSATVFWLIGGFVVARADRPRERRGIIANWMPTVGVGAVAIALLGMLLSGGSLDRYEQWKRYRWHIDSGFYPTESKDDASFWIGDIAVRTLTPTYRYLYIKWRAGDPRAAETKPTVAFSWDAKVVDERTVTDEDWHYTIINTGPAQPGQRLLTIRTDPPWVPDEVLGNGDIRRLGLRIGEIAALDEPSFFDEGFWPWESDGERKFQWSKRESIRAVPLLRGPLRFEIRAPHADIADKPVTVTMYLNTAVIREITLSDGTWHEVVIAPGVLPEDSLPDWHQNLRDKMIGFLIISVDHTWRPSDTGESTDSRDLGVAVTQVELMNAPE